MECNVKKTQYHGPRALFDPYYIPPKLLHRHEEQDMLSTCIKDSIADDFSVSILLKGIKGVGKTVLINKAIRDLTTGMNNSNQRILKIFVNCENKNLEELIVSMVLNLGQTQGINFNIYELLNLTLPRLWNFMKLISKKKDDYKIFTFYNVESLDPKILKKFIRLGKEMKVSILSTINKTNISSNLDVLAEFDVKRRIDLYKSRQLFDITKQRFNLAFPFDIDEDAINYIVDLVAEYDFLRPGKSIELIREIYPMIKKRRTISADCIRDHCLRLFDSFSLDEFGMISFISDADVLVDIFLDNLSNYFSKNSCFYIRFSELKDLYEISCESMDYEKNYSEFKGILAKLIDLEILKESKLPKGYQNNTRFYYLIIQPFQLKTMIDVVFGTKN